MHGPFECSFSRARHKPFCLNSSMKMFFKTCNLFFSFIAFSLAAQCVSIFNYVNVSMQASKSLMHHTARQQKCVIFNVRLAIHVLRPPHACTLLAPKTVLILDREFLKEPSETQSNKDDSAIHEHVHRVIFDLVIFQRDRSLDTDRPPGRFAMRDLACHLRPLSGPAGHTGPLRGAGPVWASPMALWAIGPAHRPCGPKTF